MKIDSKITDAAFLKLIGGRLARLRLNRNLTQEELAAQAGLGLRTLQRLELGMAATQLSGFARVCRVLGLMENFELLIPEPVASPLAQLKLHGKERKRATTLKAAEPAGKWEWADKK